MKWSLEQITARLCEVKQKGFISIPPDMYRGDEGVVGQLLEREFGVNENNLHVADLGDFELKGLRVNSKLMTLCHKKTDRGLTPIQVFERFGYQRPSKRNPALIKKKLFCTVSGTRANSLGLTLIAAGEFGIDMTYHQNFICGWDLEEAIRKTNQIILAVAETRGKTGAGDEQFHYLKASLLRGLKPLSGLIAKGIIVIDFCIDHDPGSKKGPHDRGPHIRMPRNRILDGYEEVRPIPI